MATEIERKFLVKNDRWRSLGTGTLYRQGYISTQGKITVRVRVVHTQGYLTIKGPSLGYGRAEFEYPIPFKDAQQMLDTICDRPLIEKTRYKIKQGDLLWEVDEFAGENQGLIVAEIELLNENQSFEIPDWIGEEVSHDYRYFNVNLAKNPYCKWTKSGN